MSDERDDIRFLIRLYHELSHPNEAIEQIDYLSEYYPSFTIDDLNLFNAVAKEAIDPLRQTIHTLDSFYISEVDDQNMNKAHALLEKKEHMADELLAICHKLLLLMNEKILPNAPTPEARAYSYKIIGDLNRYIIDSSVQNETEKAKKDAGAAYENSLHIYDTEVGYFSPIKLHAILNYAVFLFEHLQEKEIAIDLLQNALKNGEEGIQELANDHEKYDQAINSLSVMKTNLIAWTSDTSVA